ncbi:MAG: twitching motility protein PilT [Methanomassiliicoccaceae archaeon]|jgi:rRNA-processing protein FCF1|nr:twitching motility protein PilT [Methanomassiliicoccaceae archaeon]
MQTVVLDTNALLMPFEMRLNIDLAVSSLLGDVRMIVPGPMIGELKNLENKHAKAALMLARKYETYQTDSSGDDAVVEAAIRLDAFVLTNDKELKRRLRSMRIPLIYLRSDHHLVLETIS